MRELIGTALAAAEAAAAVHGAWAGKVRSDEAAEKTAASDFVTRVDLEAQEAALTRIRADFPHHRILAEEGGDADGHVEGNGDGPVWVVDPLDGTTNFLHGHPAYCASVGVVVGGRPVAGAVVAPITGERWWAARGEGAHRNGSRIRVSPTRDLRHGLVGTGFPFKLLEALPTFQRQLAAVLPATSGIRR
ncbi:MAG: inositol monophosphatase, partial [Gemmatimonadales bacterium]